MSDFDDAPTRPRPTAPGEFWRLLELAQLHQLEKQPIGEPYVYIDWLDGYVWLRSVREDDGPLRLGRHSSVELPIPDDAKISRQHALIEQTLGNVYLTDAGSANGTHLNGTQILAGRHRLKDRDSIRVGDTHVKVRIPDVGRDALTERAAPEPDWSRFSPQERRVLLTLIELWPPSDRLKPAPGNTAIAEPMGLSPKTVKGHFEKIFDKLGAQGIARDRRAAADVASQYEEALRAVHGEDAR